MNEYNFINQPTYHFYHWIRESNAFDISDMIKEAFLAAERDDEHPLADLDTSRVLQDKLALLLVEAIEGELGLSYDITDQSIGLYWEMDNGDKTWSLIRPLTQWALSEIYFDVVARKLLMDHGKWNPELVRPEVI